MPTVFRWRGFRFFFYSADGDEPPHVHVAKDGREAKIWLRDITLAINMGFVARDLSIILEKTREEQETLLEAWHDYFAD